MVRGEQAAPARTALLGRLVAEVATWLSILQVTKVSASSALLAGTEGSVERAAWAELVVLEDLEPVPLNPTIGGKLLTVDTKFVCSMNVVMAHRANLARRALLEKMVLRALPALTARQPPQHAREAEPAFIDGDRLPTSLFSIRPIPPVTPTQVVHRLFSPSSSCYAVTSDNFVLGFSGFTINQASLCVLFDLTAA